jgi:hypothetical protein
MRFVCDKSDTDFPWGDWDMGWARCCLLLPLLVLLLLVSLEGFGKLPCNQSYRLDVSPRSQGHCYN